MPRDFQPRDTDPLVLGLTKRIEIVEFEQQVTRRELRDNTDLTKETHEAVMGSPGYVGLAAKVNEMHEVFLAAKGGFKAIESLGRIAKSLAWILAIVGALWGLVTTHKWIWPGPS